MLTLFFGRIFYPAAKRSAVRLAFPHGTRAGEAGYCRERWDMKKKIEAEIAKIEETQAALRDSIARTKLLSEKAEQLLQQHKQNLEREKDA
jgi:hypothetical protein